jgi:CBS domain-containing protein
MHQALHVRDLMSPQMVTVGLEEGVKVLRTLILEGHHRHVLVVDGKGALRGVVSHRDLLAQTEAGNGDRPSTVAQIMTAPAVTVDPEATVAAAAQLMFERRLGCLPVLEGEALVGILTEADFVRHLGRR